MKVSQLKLACEEFLLEHGDQDVKLLWEQGTIDEGFDSKYYEIPTDIRAVSDWPLPGKSIIVKNEGSEMSIDFVIMYGEYACLPQSKQ
jgi:hypothetical protein